MTASDDAPQQPTPAETVFVTVGKLDEISEGEGKSFDVNDRAIAVFMIDGDRRPVPAHGRGPFGGAFRWLPSHLPLARLAVRRSGRILVR